METEVFSGIFALALGSYGAESLAAVKVPDLAAASSSRLESSFILVIPTTGVEDDLDRELDRAENT